jgi:DNA-binding NarL/FixJ family response regulator
MGAVFQILHAEPGRQYGRRRHSTRRAHPVIRVLIIEDHQLVAEGLTALLDSYPDLEVVGWVPGVAAVSTVEDLCKPDVALVDFRLPDGSGAEAAARIHARWPQTVIVFLSADDSDDAVTAAVDAGAVGYFIKSAPSEQIALAIRRAAEGETLIPAQKLAQLLVRRSAMTRESAERARVRESLTPREREILGLLAEGLDNRAIADQLHIEYSTVRSHVRKVLQKLGARSQLEAVVKATESGILT